MQLADSLNKVVVCAAQLSLSPRIQPFDQPPSVFHKEKQAFDYTGFFCNFKRLFLVAENVVLHFLRDLSRTLMTT